MEISYNGKMYNIPRMHTLETDQQLIARSWWIMTYLDEHEDNYKEALILSKYWHNIFYKNCQYSKPIMDRIIDTKYC
jgi:hypothetical protein